MQYRAMILSKQAAASAKQALKALSKPPKPLAQEQSKEKAEAKARGYAAFLERKEFKKTVRRAKASGGYSVRQSYVPLDKEYR